MADAHGRTEFIGTPLECEAWLRKFFDSIRTFLGTAVDRGDADGAIGDVFERTAWTIGIEGHDSVLPAKVRDDEGLRTYADQIELERDLLRLVTDVGNAARDETVDSASDRMSPKATDLEG